MWYQFAQVHTHPCDISWYMYTNIHVISVCTSTHPCDISLHMYTNIHVISVCTCTQTFMWYQLVPVHKHSCDISLHMYTNIHVISVCTCTHSCDISLYLYTNIHVISVCTCTQTFMWYQFAHVHKLLKANNTDDISDISVVLLVVRHTFVQLWTFVVAHVFRYTCIYSFPDDDGVELTRDSRRPITSPMC